MNILYLNYEILNKYDLSGNWINECLELKEIEKDLSINNFEEELKERDLLIEFRILNKITKTNYHIEKLINCDFGLNENRYDSILPYYYNKVIMNENNEELYINASYIDSIIEKNMSKEFIASQGPMKNTCENFWKMIYNHSNIIIMICKVSKNQCYEYFPTKEKEILKFLSIELTLLKEEINYHYVKREILIRHNKNYKIITHFQIKNWFDHKIPSFEFEKLYEIFNLIFKIKNISKTKTIHCSAGIGRTGCFICIYYIQRWIKLSKNKKLEKISVFGIIRRLREQRWGIISNELQYKFIYNYSNFLIKKIFK